MSTASDYQPPSPDSGETQTGEISELNAEGEITERISEQVKQLAKDGIVPQDEVLRARMESLEEMPIIDTSEFMDVYNRKEEDSTYRWVETDKIIGRPFGEDYKEGWAHEYNDRQGRLVEVAKSLLEVDANQESIERVFHPNNKEERLKLTAINGPEGPIYLADDGTHRVGGIKLAGLTEIPAEVASIEYPMTTKDWSQEKFDDWQKKIDLGLIKGEIGEGLNKSGKKVQQLKVESEVCEWIRTVEQSRLIKISRMYEQVYPGSLDSLPIPRDALVDQVANNYYMEGKWEEWEEKFKDHPRNEKGNVIYK